MVKSPKDMVNGFAAAFSPILMVLFIYYEGGYYYEGLVSNAKYMFGVDRLLGNYSPEYVFFLDSELVPFDLPEGYFGCFLTLVCPGLVLSFKTYTIQQLVIRYLTILVIWGFRQGLHFLFKIGGGFLIKLVPGSDTVSLVIVVFFHFVVEFSYFVVCIFWSFTRPIMFYSYPGIIILMLLNGVCFDRYLFFDFVAITGGFLWALSVCIFVIAAIIIFGGLFNTALNQKSAAGRISGLNRFVGYLAVLTNPLSLWLNRNEEDEDVAAPIRNFDAQRYRE